MTSPFAGATAPAPPAADADTVTRTRVDWAPVPRVNLLPPEILESRRFARTQRLLAGAVAGTVLLAGAGVVWAQLQVGGAAEALEQTQARTAVLRAEEAKYADVPRLLEQVRTAEAARAQALAQDALWSRLLNDLALTTPEDVSLTTLALTLTPPTGPAGGVAPGGVAAGGADPLTPAGIGDVTFSGTAARFPDVAAWLESVAELEGLDGATLRTATRTQTDGSGPGALTWTSTIRVTSDVLSHRYDRKAS